MIGNSNGLWTPDGRVLPATSIPMGLVAFYQNVHLEKRCAKTGMLLWEHDGRNALTSVGVALWMKSSLSGQTENGQVWSDIAVGTGSTAADVSDLALQTEIDRGPVDTWLLAGLSEENPWFRAFKLFGPEEAIGVLRECGLFNDVLDVMLARFVFPAEDKTADHTFGVRYDIYSTLNIEVIPDSA